MQTAQYMKQGSQRQRRSERLTPDEFKAFKKHANSFDTKRDAAEYYGFSLVTLDNILLKGSGKPYTIQGIREKLTALQPAA